ncbi:MAG TPA: fibronectin type III domain-containing protein [Thermoanaerobaculia bacterium]|nr:fibronectin type III domain-containing protein [Thermoanaerobaculia bacterium]
MRTILLATAFLLSAPLAGQPFFFGEPAPLTTTRYAADGGAPRLATNGVHPYLLWANGGKVRLARLQDVPGAGRPVLDGTLADAVWTGLHFVVVAFQEPSRYVMRRVAASGEPIGAPVTLLGDAPSGQPHLSFDGARVLLVYGSEPVRMLLLSRDGQPLDEPRTVPLETPVALDADVTARSGELLLAIAARQNISLGTLYANGAWARNDRAAVGFLSRDIATAASATDQLTIWTNGAGPMHAWSAGADAGAPQDLANTNGAADVDVTWDGRDFIYAYRIGTRVYIRSFNAPAPFTSVETAPGSDVELVSVGSRTFLAFHANRPGRPIVVRDVLALSTGEVGAYAARAQSLQSTASSASAALVVWMEGDRELYAGVRTSDGAWYERRIANADERAPLAASDGNGFVIVQSTLAEGWTWTATLLDGQGNILGVGPRVPFEPTGIAWTGDAYVVVGVDAAQRLVGSRLGLSGIASPPAILATPRAGRTLQGGRVAARAGELLVIWTDSTASFSDVLGARFTPSLQRLDTQSLLFAEPQTAHPDVAWDGTRYVIAWQNTRDQALEYRTMRTNAAVSGVTKVAGVKAEVPRVTVVPGGVAITAGGGNVLFLREGAETVAKLGIDAPHALATADSRLVYVQAMPRDEMPYHGATRLNVRIGDLVPPGPKPSAPRITRATHPTGGIAMIVEWSAPPEPVNGYRVEYRVDDGPWNELDEWFDARTRQLTIRPWRTGEVRYQFRVRAVNDSGFSPYSNPATVRTRKMRAVQ